MTAYTAFQLEQAGATKEGISFDVRTRGGAFAGIISHRYNGVTRVWFNSTATRGSARKFRSIQEAAEFIYNRRVKKGWRV